MHGRTLLLTSHDTGDMERVCERVIVIHHGRLLLDQPVAALRRGYIRKKRVVLQIAARELALALPGVRVVHAEPHRVELEVEVDVTPVDALLQAVLRATHVQDLTIEDPPMDEIVQAIYRGVATARARCAAAAPAPRPCHERARHPRRAHAAPVCRVRAHRRFASACPSAPRCSRARRFSALIMLIYARLWRAILPAHAELGPGSRPNTCGTWR